MIFREPKVSELPRLKEIWKEAFDDGDDVLDDFERTAFSPSRTRVAAVGEEIAAALYFFDCECDGERIAYLYAIATAKKHRGRGICRALMADTHRHLKTLGYRGALLSPAEDSLFIFYERLGYTRVGYLKEILTSASGKCAKLTEIDKSEYALLRRGLLTSGAVIQEGASLDFLETQEKFYRGEDFILCAHAEGDFLSGAELIGNTSSAADILTALGCKNGIFRTVGGEKRFFSYLPFTDTSPRPTYFALALD